MKTVSVSIENLFVPCNCRCRHCLLSAEKQVQGTEYHRGQAFAEKFITWAREYRSDLNVSYYVGCCMDFPELPEYIRFTKKHTPQLDFLLFDGMKLRSEEDTALLLRTIHEAGINGIVLTFYGVGSYHDGFAGRKGDFDYLLLLLRKAKEEGVWVNAGIALTQDNMDQMPELFAILDSYKIATINTWLPHAKGRGEALSSLRLTQADFEDLYEPAKSCFSKIPHYTEASWLERGSFPNATARNVTLSLTKDNIDRLESMDPSDILTELEQMDDRYYNTLAPIDQLSKEVGRADNQQIFRFRDLYLQWQKRYWQIHPMTVQDMNDERHSFSVRMYNER